MRFIISAIFCVFFQFFWFNYSFGQIREQELDSVVFDRHFNLHYAQNLNKLRRVYPIAVEAKRIIDSLDNALSDIDGRRKQKKYSKSMQRDLEDRFTYLIKDLYIEEGVFLMKLIHRETGLTVDDIISKYIGNFKAGVSRSTFALFGHDTRIEYNAKGDDWITEIVIQDIINKKVECDMTLRTVTKNDYKQGMKDYRSDKKKMKRDNKQRKQIAKDTIKNKKASD